MTPLFSTTLVGSFPQPEWLIDRDKPGKRFPPRLRSAYVKMKAMVEAAKILRAEHSR